MECLDWHQPSLPTTVSSFSSDSSVVLGEAQEIIFSFFTHLSPSSIRVGGSLPVVLSYFSEFFSRKSRGPFVIILASFWILGSLFAALLAWIVIGQFNGSTHSHLGAMTMETWRIYVILCTFPCLSSAFAFIFLPESPSFLFSVRVVRPLTPGHSPLHNTER